MMEMVNGKRKRREVKKAHTGELMSLREYGRRPVTLLSLVREECGRIRLRRVSPSPEFLKGLFALPNIFVRLAHRSECLVG